MAEMDIRATQVSAHASHVSIAGHADEPSKSRPAHLNPPQYIDGRGSKFPLEQYSGVIDFANERELWEQQPDEPRNPFFMFSMYRNLPPWERTLVALHKQFLHIRGRATWTRVPDAYSLWKKMYRWEERCEAFDRFEDAEALKQLNSRRIQSRLETATIGRVLRQRAFEALEVLEATLYEYHLDEDGVRQRIARSALSPAQIVKLADIGVKLERLALGMDEAAQGQGRGPMVAVQVNIGGDEELINRATEVIESRTRYTSASGES